MTLRLGPPEKSIDRDDGFHEGELRAQHRAGVAEQAQRLAGMLTEPHLSEGMGRFIAERDLVFVTAEDADGRLWTSPVTGGPGFCEGHDQTLTMRATVADGDPLQGLRVGQPVGVLLVDFPRRRRLRVNGTVAASDADLLSVDIGQAFGNCPRYITPRHLAPAGDVAAAPPASVSRSAALEPADIAVISAADTFVLGTLHPERGADTSHRGGAPGFVRCADGELWWPDYPGNNLFNSLGNMLVNPAAALLFVDVDRGSVLQLSGRATVEWAAPDAATPDDVTGRRVRFIPDLVVRSTGLRARASGTGGTPVELDRQR